MFGRIFDHDYRVLEQSLRSVAQERLHDMFEVRMRLDDSLALSYGTNELIFPGDGSVVASISVGSYGADMSNMSDVFTMVEDFYHELAHVEHRAEAYKGNAFSNRRNMLLSVAYLARGQDGFRYKAGYYQNMFETDAHLRSIVPARDFCMSRYPSVDFDGIAVALWKSWSKFEGSRFVDNPDVCRNAEDIVSQLKSHLEKTIDARPTRCGVGSDMYVYLKRQASDAFLDRWVNAKSDMERNVLSAALFSVQRPDKADRDVPGASSTHFCLSGFDVTRDISSHMVSVFDRSDAEIFSKLDTANMLRSAFYAEHDALVVSCNRERTNDVVTIDGTGYRITHTSLARHGLETFLFDDDACAALDKIVDSLSREETYVLSGSLPDVISQMVDIRKRSLLLQDARSPISGVVSSRDFESDDFELG